VGELDALGVEHRRELAQPCMRDPQPRVGDRARRGDRLGIAIDRNQPTARTEPF
jgi:hypothetical protein